MTIWELQTRKYLGMVKKQAQIVDHLEKETKEIDRLLHSVGSPGTEEKVQVSPAADKTLNQLIKLGNKKAELAAACNAYADFRRKVMDEIHKIPNKNQREVLYRYYLQFQSFHSIAEELYFNYSYITQIHRKGIQSFFRINKDVVENSLQR